MDFLFPLLKHCFDNFDVQKIREAMRYTLAHVDVIWHAEMIQPARIPSMQVAATV